jgi:hypothetical protein
MAATFECLRRLKDSQFLGLCGSAVSMPAAFLWAKARFYVSMAKAVSGFEDLKI